MRRVVRALCGGLMLVWVLLAGVSANAQPAPAERPAAVPADAKKVKSLVPTSPASITAGSLLFQKYCKFCHGASGKGDSPMAPKTMHPSNLTDAEWTRGSSDGEIFWVIQNGAPPKYDMKGLKAKLSDQDIWNLVNYVRSLGSVTKSH